jgi:hypothetical protein
MIVYGGSSFVSALRRERQKVFTLITVQKAKSSWYMDEFGAVAARRVQRGNLFLEKRCCEFSVSTAYKKTMSPLLSPGKPR